MIASGAAIAAEVVPDASRPAAKRGEGASLRGASVRANPRFTGTPVLRVWRTEDYRAAETNWRIAVSPAGLLYVGNDDGVLEFDGDGWRLIPLPRAGAATALAIDREGTVWAGGHDIVCRLRPDATGRLRAESILDRLPADQRNVGKITRALAAPEGIFFRSRTRTVFFGQDGSTRNWRSPDTPAVIWSQGEAVYADLAPISRVERGAVTPASPDFAAAGALPTAFLRVFAAEMAQGSDALLLTSRGPARWAGAGAPLRPVSAESRGLFDHGLATAGAFLADGRLAFGTERAGVLVLTHDGVLLQRIEHGHGLPAARINDMTTDAEGGLWLALDNGIARLALDAPFALHAAAQGLSASPRNLAAVGDRLYVTHAAGAARRDTATGNFINIEGFEIGANRLFVDHGRVLAGTRGLLEILPDDRARVWTHALITPMVPAPQAPGWIVAGTSHGLALLVPDAATGGWHIEPRVTTTLRRELVELLETGDGFVWGVDRNGVVLRADFRTRGSDHTPRSDPPVTVFGETEGLPAVGQREPVRLLSARGSLFVVTSQWIRRLDPAAQRFVLATTQAGAPPVSGVLALGPGAASALWLQPANDTRRLVRWHPSSGYVDRTVGIAPLSALRLEVVFEENATRTLWAAAPGALASIDLEWRPARPPPPLRALIRRVETRAGEMLFGGAADLALRSHLSTLNSDQDSLRFTFAAPTFNADHRGDSRTVYRTRLDGLEDTWSAWTHDPHREFTNLPYRALTLRVQARALDGRESEETVFAFALTPPWWLTRWAFGGYALAGALGVASIVRLRTRALRRRAHRLESIVAARTTELATKNVELARLHQLELDEKIAAKLTAEKALLEVLRYQLNPHFLYNALASVRALVRIDPDRADAMVTRLVEFCRLTLTRSDDAPGTLGDEFDLLRLYLDMEKTRWGPQLEFTIETEPAARPMRLPPFLILPLVENAVKYGGQTTEGVLRIRLSARCAEDAIVIEVANTGTWVEPEAARARGSTGIGVENLRKRLRRHFPDAHKLSMEAKEGWVVARLRLAGEWEMADGSSS